ncbi:MAG TPA: copper-binding protein [Balneolales bacterium]|nr:copper-binding protein [Balneolales bacterium]
MKKKEIIIGVFTLMFIIGSCQVFCNESFAQASNRVTKDQLKRADKKMPDVFTVNGQILRVMPQRRRVVLSHDEIEGFMRAMPQMTFIVPSAEMLQGFNEGDKVVFQFDRARRRELVSLKKIP